MPKTMAQDIRDIKGTLFIERKAKSYFPLYELISLKRLESEFFTDYIIRAESISNSLKEAGKVISDV